MPARKGAQQLNISLPNELVDQLTTMAGGSQYHGSKSQVLEVALRTLIKGSAELTSLDAIHQHISSQDARYQEGIHAVLATLKEVTSALLTTQTRVTQLEQAVSKHHAEFLQVYDTSQTPQKHGGVLRSILNR